MWSVFIYDEEQKELRRQKAPGSCPYCAGNVEAVDIEIQDQTQVFLNSLFLTGIQVLCEVKMMQEDKKMKVKKGWLAVQEGLANVDDDDAVPQRFLIPISYLHHPLVVHLLDRAYKVYGYNTDGPLRLPCSVDVFSLCLLPLLKNPFVIRHRFFRLARQYHESMKEEKRLRLRVLFLCCLISDKYSQNYLDGVWSCLGPE